MIQINSLHTTGSQYLLQLRLKGVPPISKADRGLPHTGASARSRSEGAVVGPALKVNLKLSMLDN